MTNKFTIQLGDKVKCNISELEGRVTALERHIYSVDRVNVQPPYNKESGTMPSGYTIDVTNIEVLEKSKLAVVHQYEDGPIALGDEIKCTLSGVVGTVDRRILNINGCYSLEIATRDSAGDPRHMKVEEKGCEVIKPIAETKTKPANRDTGCAMASTSGYGS